MARFGRMFEVKGEMRDVKEIVPDDKKQTGGKTSKENQEEIDKEGNKVGFEDIDMDEILDEKEESSISEEFKAKNDRVEAELNQYLTYDISNEVLKAYLTQKISEIYGDKLEQYNLVGSSMVEGFMESNEFEKAEDYRKLTQIVEDSITLMSAKEVKVKKSEKSNISESTKISHTKDIPLENDGSPKVPEGWTYLRHGSNMDKWDESMLENDFVVGDGFVAGQKASNRPLCCVERDTAKYEYMQSKGNAAESYGKGNKPFEIRVLLYKDPFMGKSEDKAIVNEKLSEDEKKDVHKYYMYQGGRHPAVPTNTKLVYIKNTEYDEITGTDGNNIMWYIPEQYLEKYLEDVKDREKGQEPEETGAILHSVNGIDIYDSAVEATEINTKLNVIEKAKDTMVQFQKYRTQPIQQIDKKSTGIDR